MAERILVVDDEIEIANLIEVYLKNENYEILKCYTADVALNYIDTEQIDLAILDIMLPGTDGFEICRYIREAHHYPVIMLTAKDSEMDKITGLTLGADDYITKPFRPLELLARVKAQLRRYKKYNPALMLQNTDSNTMIHKDLILNINTHECFLEDQEILLTPTEFSILRILLEHKGNVVNAEDLFHEIWKDEYYNKSNNTITVHIRHLREKLHDEMEHPEYIRTVWGLGYKIEK